MSEIVMPRNCQKQDYFAAAVLYILSGENVKVRCAKDGEESPLRSQEVHDTVLKATPGYNSYLMNLAIISNVHEAVIDDPKLSLAEKVKKVAEGISKFVKR